LVHLERCVLEVPGIPPIGFTLAEERRRPLLEGLDQLSVMLRSMAAIEAFEQRAAQEQPWL